MNTPYEQSQADNRSADLTISELKSYRGLEYRTDERSAQIIASLKELSILLCYYADKKQQSSATPIIHLVNHKQAA